MLMVCHHLDKNIPEDVAFAESRIRGETIAAEDILHDMGAISIMASDSQAMGRVGEVITRTWQTADKMKRAARPAARGGRRSGNDNLRIKRYVAKYTINPALAHGMSHLVGSVGEGPARRPRAVADRGADRREAGDGDQNVRRVREQGIVQGVSATAARPSRIEPVRCRGLEPKADVPSTTPSR